MRVVSAWFPIVHRSVCSLLSQYLGLSSRSRREHKQLPGVSAQTESCPELGYTPLIRHRPVTHNPVITSIVRIPADIRIKCPELLLDIRAESSQIR